MRQYLTFGFGVFLGIVGATGLCHLTEARTERQLEESHALCQWYRGELFTEREKRLNATEQLHRMTDRVMRQHIEWWAVPALDRDDVERIPPQNIPIPLAPERKGDRETHD